MALAIRISLAPQPRGGGHVVSGVEIHFTSFGAGQSLLKSGSSATASLVFHAKFIERAREPSGALTEFARLSGTLRRGQDSGQLRFVLPPNGDFEYADPPVAGELRQALTVTFDPTHFEGAAGFGGGRPRLVLPKLEERSRYLEIYPELTLNGAPESPLEASPPLDVPLARQAMYGLLLLDELDAPLADVELQFEVGSHSDRVTTDGDGRARILLPRRSAATVRVTQASAWRARFDGLAPTERRGSALPDPCVLATPRMLVNGMQLAPDQEARVIVVARLGLKHPSAATPWQGLELRSEGPFAVTTERDEKLTAVHARSDANDQRLVVAKPESPGGAARDWLSVAIDDLHDALAAGLFQNVFRVLAAIPVEGPEQGPMDASADPAVALALAEATAELAAQGEIDLPSIEARQI